MSKKREEFGYVDLFSDDQEAHAIGDIIKITVRARVDSIKNARGYGTKKKYVYDCTILKVEDA